MRSKTILLISIFTLIIFSAYFFHFWPFSKKTYDQPLGGWEELVIKIHKKYASKNQDIQKAAILLGKAYQEAIDYPDKAQEIRPSLSKANSCFRAVLEFYGSTSKESYDEFNFMEDLSTSSFQRQKRYIHYNAKLSGGVYSLTERKLENCNFKLDGLK